MRDGFKRRLEDFKMKRDYFSVAEKLEELINSREKTQLNVRVFVAVKLAQFAFTTSPTTSNLCPRQKQCLEHVKNRFCCFGKKFVLLFYFAKYS